ncbi:MAG: glycosyltransferase family 61 protein [Hymenobacter sp.]|nr:MAG: glycosyltransferase family 61 protein [Hymenobacter sp.]
MPLNWAELASYTQLFSILSSYTNSQITLPIRRIFLLKNRHITWKGVVFDNLKVFVPSLVYPALESHYNGTFLFKQWFGKKITLPNDIVFGLVYNHWASLNYYHWLIDTLPRLVALRNLHPDATIILPYSATPYMMETVALLGYKKTFKVPEDTSVKIPQLAFVEKAGTFLHQDAQLLLEIASSIISQVAPIVTIPKRRIYASRSRANIRKISNESGLLCLLHKYNFEIIYFEDYAFTEQVKIMRDVDIIIGLHGANLTNILFMQKGTTVIELMNSSSPNLVYFQLASYLELSYYILPCMPDDDTGAHNDANVLVDLLQVENILQPIGNGQV